jgi:flagellar M-ring protein FliF
MTRQVENDLEDKAQSMLDGVLGPGKGIVRVTAELDFQQYSRTSENFDPNMTAVVSEQRTEGSNMASSKGAEDAEDREEDRSEVTVTNYEVSKTIESVQNAVGTIKRLSVAVMLDGSYTEAENTDGVMETVYEPRPQEEIDRLSSIVKNAVGFSTERNDQMEIVNIAFDKSYFSEQQQAIDQQYTREFYYDIIKKVALILAAILAVLYLRKRIKSFFASLGKILPPSRVHPTAPSGHSTMPASPEVEDGPEPEMDIPEIVPEKRQVKLVDRMQKVAKDKPEEIAKVIKTIMVD